MDIDFDWKSSGCGCECGEYMQQVKGYQMFDLTGKGNWQKDPRIDEMTKGVYLSEDIFQEDGVVGLGAYGHRFWDDMTRTQPKPQLPVDMFLPKRENGCEYRGKDEPAIEIRKAGAKVKMDLEFMGGPVEVCQTPGQRLIQPLQSHWHFWRISGEAQAKSPPPGPTKGPVLTPTRFIVKSGVPKDPERFIGEEITLEIALPGQPDHCIGKIEVGIISMSKDLNMLMVLTHNSEQVNVAPEDCPDMWVYPYEVLEFFPDPEAFVDMRTA
jgi:hypothetical protein